MNVALNRIRTAAETAVLESFVDIEAGLPGTPEAHADRRRRMALFERVGLPTRRIEAWKYTDLRTLVRDLAPLSETVGDAQRPEARIDGAHQIVMIDGIVSAGQSDLPAGVTLTPFAEALAEGALTLKGEDHPDRTIDAWNAAFVRDGYALKIDEGTTLETPLELVFLRSGSASQAHARVAVTIGKDARATITERHLSPDTVATQSSAVTSYTLGEGATLDLLRLQKEGNEALHLGEVSIDLAANAEAKLLHLVAGAKVMRTDTRATFSGEGARFDVAGISMTADRQHADLTLYVDHLVPHCESTETFKSVIDDAAKGIFQGKIVVAPDAQKTDAQMAVNTLLLSETADMVAKPELEIFADDVSCAHGATCGDIDEDLMFYLLARGIPTNQARKLLLQAFLSEGAQIFEDHPFEEIAFAEVETWLEAHAAR